MEQKCKDRINEHYDSRIETIKNLWKSYLKGEEYCKEEETNLWEFGLSFCYVPANTFQDQEEGYFQWLLSWGGPSDEFRFYCDPEFNVYKIEYWFLDWFDEAKTILTEKEFDLLKAIFDDLKEIGMVEVEFKKALEE